VVLFIMMVFWALLILLAIVQTQYSGWQWNLPTIFGLVFVIGVSTHRVHGTWMFEFVYASSVENYPTYLNDFQTMVAKFHVNA
jgi:hypothetical protein